MIMFVMLTIATLTLRRRLSPKKVSGGLLNLKAFLHIPYTLYVLASVVSFLGLYTGEFLVGTANAVILTNLDL